MTPPIRLLWTVNIPLSAVGQAFGMCEVARTNAHRSEFPRA